MSRNLYAKYVWLVDTIRRSGNAGITFEEITQRLVLSRLWDGRPYSKRTFHHQKGEIEDTFDIVISCNRSTNRYYIECDSPETDALHHWLYDTFMVSNLLYEGEGIKDSILVEDIPSAQEFLTDFIQAIKDHVVIEMLYHSFLNDRDHLVCLEPYFIKLYKRRWYVFGKDRESKKMKVFSFDRIMTLRLLNERFEKPIGFSPAAYLKDCMGIARYDDILPCRIVLKVYDVQQKYITSLPLHHSQKKIESGDNYTIFEYFLSPTIEFYQEILRYGEGVEVISPAEVRDSMQTKIDAIANRYKK